MKKFLIILLLCCLSSGAGATVVCTTPMQHAAFVAHMDPDAKKNFLTVVEQSFSEKDVLDGLDWFVNFAGQKYTSVDDALPFTKCLAEEYLVHVPDSAKKSSKAHVQKWLSIR